MGNKEDIYVGVGGFQTTPKMREYVLDVLKSGRLSYGPYISRFENEFARIHGRPFGVMSNSGTSSLLVALQTLRINYGWNDGDEVIVPATTFVATANIVIHNNMRPVFVDIEQDYYGINPKLIEAKITDKTRCIIPAHLFGMPCKIDEIMDIARKRDLKVIEDSCETMFAKFEEKPVGSFGDIACFSTYVAHILMTGVGGISITSNPEYAVTMRSLVNHGRDSIYFNIDDDKNKSAEQMKEIIERRSLFIHPGHSFRVTEMEGALGLAQLEDWESNIGQRQDNARFLTERLAEFKEHLQLPRIRPGATHAFMMYPILVKSGHKGDLCNYLEHLGVETRDMLPLINQPFFRQSYSIKEGDYPVSERILDRGFYIGCHLYLGPTELNHIIRCFRSYFKEKTFARTTTVALVVITSPDIRLSQEIFSRIDKSQFSSILVIDFYPKENIGAEFSKMGYDVINVLQKSLLEVYVRAQAELLDDYMVFFQLDGSQDSAEIPSIVSHLMLGYDLVIGSRFIPEGKRYDSDSFVPFRGVGNRLITLLLNLFFDSNFSDSYQPFRGVSMAFLKAADLSAKRLINYQMSIRAVTMKQKICEVPSKEKRPVKRMGFFKALWIGLMTIPFVIAEKVSKRQEKETGENE